MTTTTTNNPRPFLQAKPADWFITIAQAAVRADFAVTNHVHVNDAELQRLENIPHGTGVIVTPNHADESDPLVCLDLSRRARRRFVFMGNREAFDEWNGIAGWGLQRMGVFSVERGGHDVQAKQYAIDVVRGGRQDLVIFPEGEIFYLNDSVQPFHSGAVEIGIKSILAARKDNPKWTAKIVPVAIKYRYSKDIHPVLEQRVHEMERKLRIDKGGQELRTRLAKVLGTILEEQETLHNLQTEAEHYHDLSERLTRVRHEILLAVQQRNRDLKATQARTIDRAWQLSGQMRNLMASGVTPERRMQLLKDLTDLSEVAHMVSIKPDYMLENADPCIDRMAEVVLKLEREVYKIKRPRPLGPRNCYVRVGDPVDLSQYLDEYHAAPHPLRHKLSDQLRTTVQNMIDTTSAHSR